MSKTIGYGEATITNMTEPFTVMLTNEAQQFATDSNRKVSIAQSYYTDIMLLCQDLVQVKMRVSSS